MKIICSWCKKFIGEKEPFDDPSETHAKCSACLDQQRIADEALKKREPAPSRPSIKGIIKKETVILGIVLVIAFLNRSSSPAASFSSYSSSSKISSYGNSDSNNVSMNFQLSFFWVIIYGYSIYLFFRVIFIAVKLLRKPKPALFLGLLLFSIRAYAGDIPETKLNQISLGMKPETIISILGKPDAIRAEGLNADGKSVERIEYNVTRRIDMTKVENDTGERISTSLCSLMVVDGVLVRIDIRR